MRIQLHGFESVFAGEKQVDGITYCVQIQKTLAPDPLLGHEFLAEFWNDEAMVHATATGSSAEEAEQNAICLLRGEYEDEDNEDW